MDDFIKDLEKVFTVNNVADGKKHIVVAACLKGMIASYHASLANNIQLKHILETRF